MNALKDICRYCIFTFTILNVEANEVDWSKVNCPQDKAAYIDEAIKLITSGYLSNKDSECLKQENFKYFNLAITDISDRAAPNPIVINDDYKASIVSKTPRGTGNLEVTYKIVSGDKTETDKFVLYYTINQKGTSANGCVAFFDLPSKMFLKKSCQPRKSK
jgi:hypothetical protein